MAVKDALLPEFDHEMAVTRRVLERVPFADVDWKPHAKSMSMGALASHVAEIPNWVPALLRDNGYDMGGDNPINEAKHANTQVLLTAFDGSVKAARDLIANTNDAQFMEPWTLKEKGKEVFTLPRIATVRSFLLSHTIHHRGQLTVYLRLRDIPIPAIYGPSADER